LIPESEIAASTIWLIRYFLRELILQEQSLPIMRELDTKPKKKGTKHGPLTNMNHETPFQRLSQIFHRNDV
jgi:hypothetical protein